MTAATALLGAFAMVATMTAEVTAQHQGSLHGRVIADDTGTPMAGVRVGASTAARAPLHSPTSLISDFGTRNQLMPGQRYRILRLDLDLTGNGVPELLLAKSLRHAQLWDIYSWAGDKQLKYLGTVGFSHQAFLLTSSPVRLVATSSNGADEFVYKGYVVDASGIRDVPPDSAIPAVGLKAEDFAEWRRVSHLRLLSAEFGDVESSMLPEWRDETTGDPVPGIGALLDLAVLPPH